MVPISFTVEPRVLFVTPSDDYPSIVIDTQARAWTVVGLSVTDRIPMSKPTDLVQGTLDLLILKNRRP